jgi:hypothetical protein
LRAVHGAISEAYDDDGTRSRRIMIDVVSALSAGTVRYCSWHWSGGRPVLQQVVRNPRVDRRRYRVACATLLLLTVVAFALFIHLLSRHVDVADYLVGGSITAVLQWTGIQLLLHIWLQTSRWWLRLLSSLAVAWLAFSLIGTLYFEVFAAHSFVSDLVGLPVVFFLIGLFGLVGFFYIWVPFGVLAFILLNKVVRRTRDGIAPSP